MTIELLLLLTVANDLPNLNGLDSSLVESIFFLLVVFEDVFGLGKAFLLKDHVGTEKFKRVF